MCETVRVTVSPVQYLRPQPVATPIEGPEANKTGLKLNRTEDLLLKHHLKYGNSERCDWSRDYPPIRVSMQLSIISIIQ